MTEKQNLFLDQLKKGKTYGQACTYLKLHNYGDLSPSDVKKLIEELKRLNQVKTEYGLAIAIEKPKWIESMKPILKRTEEDSKVQGFADGFSRGLKRGFFCSLLISSIVFTVIYTLQNKGLINIF